MLGAIERARAGAGPQAVEALTLRMHGHAAHDDGRYMDRERLRTFADRFDPVERLAARLRLDGLSIDQIDTLRRAAADEVSSGLAEAEAAPAPDPATLADGVYAMPPEGTRTMSQTSARPLALDDGALFRTQAYIDGAWVDADSGATFDVLNPATGELLAEVPRCGADETRRAIEAAEAAQPAWRARTAKERAHVLRRWHDLLHEHMDDLALLLTSEQGKPLAEARGEIAYAASFLEWFGEEAKRAYGDVIPPPAHGMRIVVTKEPIGVTAGITPWNFPAAMIARKAAPALAAGCAMVVKPAEQTPLSALALAELAERAGVPRGILSIITGSAADAPSIGGELTSNPIVRKLGFTGSTEVGKLLMAQCAGQVKKVSLELGGNAPFLVFDDADLDAAVAGAMIVQVPELRADLHQREPDLRAGRRARRVRASGSQPRSRACRSAPAPTRARTSAR